MADEISQFCRKSVLSKYFNTYILYQLYQEPDLYGYVSYRKDLDGVFNPDYNDIVPTPSEIPYAWRYDTTTGAVLECGQIIKRVLRRALIKEFIDPQMTNNTKFADYRVQWEADRRAELGIGPTDPFVEVFDPYTFFDGWIYFDLSGFPIYYFEWDQAEDGDVFDVLPQALIFETYLSYDTDIINFHKPEPIADLWSEATTPIPGSDDFNDFIPNKVTYNKLMLLKDPKLKPTGDIAHGLTYYPNDFQHRFLLDTNDDPILSEPWIDCVPIEISFQTSVTRDAFQRDQIQWLIIFDSTQVY